MSNTNEEEVVNFFSSVKHSLFSYHLSVIQSWAKMPVALAGILKLMCAYTCRDSYSLLNAPVGAISQEGRSAGDTRGARGARGPGNPGIPTIAWHIHTYIHTYLHTYIHACMHACMHACINTFIHTCITHIYEDTCILPTIPPDCEATWNTSITIHTYFLRHPPTARGLGPRPVLIDRSLKHAPTAHKMLGDACLARTLLAFWKT